MTDLLKALRSAQQQLTLCHEYALEHRLSKIDERIRHSIAWVNATVQLAEKQDAIVEEAQP